MDNRSEVRDFLVSRRGRINPEQAGLPTFGGKRRVAGLRREEVAMLAGVSVDYYTRLERGHLGGASETVLDAVSNALQLDEAERGHLFDLARTASASPVHRPRSSVAKVRPVVQQILDAMTGAPALVRNARLDYLAANQLGRALYADLVSSPAGPPNVARFVFLDLRSREFYDQWDKSASDVVAILRGEAGRNPYDRALSDLVGELSMRSDEFRVRWAAHNVRLHRTGVKRLHHRVVGTVDLQFEALEVAADPGLWLHVYSAAPGTPSADAISLLASWAATQEAAAEIQKS